MGKRPRIGITPHFGLRKREPYYFLHHGYVDGTRDAGGEPVILPVFRSSAEIRRFLSRLDGLILSGGDDLDPRHWGQKRRHPKAVLLRPERDRSEIPLANAAIRSGMPILAICLGSQVVNVVLGGTIHQHMPDLPGIGRAHAKSRSFHMADIEPGSRLARIMGTTRARVNSIHHQAGDRIGRGLRVVARACDGIPEGFEAEADRFLIGVQWHPERMLRFPEHARIFRALVRACRERR